MAREGGQQLFGLSEHDRRLVNQSLRRSGPITPEDFTDYGVQQLGYTVGATNDKEVGTIDLAVATNASPTVLTKSGRTRKAYNLTGVTLADDTLVEVEHIAVLGYSFPRMRPTSGGGISRWIWGTALEDILFGETGQIRVVGGAEPEGSEQTVHYLAIDGLQIDRDLRILAVYTRLESVDNTQGYLIVDAGCTEPPPMRWGGVIEPEEPEA